MAKAKGTEPPRLWARVIVGCGFFAVTIALIAAATISVHYATWRQRPVMAEGRVNVIVPKGTSWSGVVDLLAEAGVVTQPRYFDFWGRQEGLPSRVKAGAYTFEGPLAAADLARMLSEGGRVAEIAVTVPEGFNIWAIAARLDEAGLVNRTQFLAAVRDPSALAKAGITGESFEGYLFPDTYRFATGSTAPQIVDRMYQRFVEVYTELGNPPELHGLNLHELVTLASIVEKETAAAAERPLIARVFYNRLAINMKLQTDPTCVYSEERWSHPPTPADCKDPLNRYSTYVVARLPPGPIAAPGKAALQAVLHPDASPDNEGVLYFVAIGDGSGRHTFSRTLEEHNAAIKQLIVNRAGP